MVAKKKDKLKELVELLSNEKLEYDYSGNNGENAMGEKKKKFKTLSKAFLKDLAIALGLKNYEISFNPGGIAVSGEAYLEGIWASETRLEIIISSPMFVGYPPMFLYRIAERTKKNNGSNHYMNSQDLNDMQRIVEKISLLKRIIENQTKTSAATLSNASNN